MSSVVRQCRARCLAALVAAASLGACGGSTEPRPSLAVTPGSLSSYGSGAGQLHITNAGGGTLAWTAFTDAPWWVTLYLTHGTAPSVAGVTWSAAGFHAGIHNATITVDAPDVAGPPVVIPLVVTVPSLTGRWDGLRSGVSLDLFLTETLDTVTGTGNIVFTNGSFPVIVSGLHAEPSITLTLNFPSPYVPAVFTGEFNGPRSVVGRLNGSGFVNFTYTLALVDSTASR